MNKDNIVSLEFLQANNTVSSVISPTPVTGLTVTRPTRSSRGAGITPGAAGLDPTEPATANWRQTTVGGRASSSNEHTYRIMAAWEGSYKGWDYALTALQSRADVTNTFTGGYVNRTTLQNGLSAGGTADVPWLNPFGEQSAEGQAYLMSSRIIGEVQKAEGTLTDISARVSGEVAKLPAGSMLLALGVGYMKDEAEYTNNFTLIRQAASSGSANDRRLDGDRNYYGGLAELIVPIVKTARAQRRRSATTTTATSAARPTRRSRLRWNADREAAGARLVGHGLRRADADAGLRRETPSGLSEAGLEDPLRCPTTGRSSSTADAVQRWQFGGNPDLDPQTSDQWHGRLGLGADTGVLGGARLVQHRPRGT